MTPVTPTRWRKATASEANGNNCVEVGHAPGVIGLRDTKNRDGGMLTIASERFTELVAAIKDGRLS